MSRTIIAICIAVMLSLLCATGCAKKSKPPAPAQEKTAAEYKAEADKQITQENAPSELDKLQQDINKDAAAEGQ